MTQSPIWSRLFSLAICYNQRIVGLFRRSAMSAITLDQVLDLAHQLSPRDPARLVARLALVIEDAGAATYIVDSTHST
jgi:hypothetical protein